MKLMYMTPFQFLGAIFIGVVLAVLFGMLTAPHYVEEPVIKITPVPTPEPVQIHEDVVRVGVSQPDENNIVSLLPALILAAGLAIIIAPLLLFWCD